MDVAMKNLSELVTVTGLFVLTLLPTPPEEIKPRLGLAARIHVTEVYDGDTLTGEITIPIRVRLLDNWSPEISPRKVAGGVTRTEQELAAERNEAFAAKMHLEKLALDKWGTIWIPWDHASRMDDVLTFGRVLAHVWIDGQEESLSALQVSSGHASSTKDGRLGE